MEPVGLLMREHRLIDRLILVLKDELVSIQNTETLNTDRFYTIIDFIVSYVDKIHHGKEEDILFKEILKKEISNEHRAIIDDLVREHGVSRITTKEIKNRVDAYKTSLNKTLLGQVFRSIEILTELYPRHIAKEDKEFFMPVLNYFTRSERDEMIKKFYDFDRNVLHDKYIEIIDSLEIS
jgi:hemerythrin-like domain-containing protein